MIVRKQPLVKLLELIDQVYQEKPGSAGPGRPYTYSERTMFKCFIVKVVKRLDDCSGLYRYLKHEANQSIRTAVGLVEQFPCLKTFQRRFEQSASLLRRQVGAVARTLVERGVVSFEMLAVDGTICDALGPDWHKSDKNVAHIPEKLRNLDLLAEWGKSGYRGWTYGYKALALCNCSPTEPAIFVEGWVETANVCETISVRAQLAQTGLPKGNRLLLADSGFDDKELFELCWPRKNIAVTRGRVGQKKRAFDSF